MLVTCRLFKSDYCTCGILKNCWSSSKSLWALETSQTMQCRALALPPHYHSQCLAINLDCLSIILPFKFISSFITKAFEILRYLYVLAHTSTVGPYFILVKSTVFNWYTSNLHQCKFAPTYMACFQYVNSRIECKFQTENNQKNPNTKPKSYAGSKNCTV